MTSPPSDTASKDLHQQLAAMQEECLRLRQENERLRRMLGLPAEVAEPTLPTQTEPRLFPSFEPLPTVNSNSPVQEKIALFWRLFRGREDLYPVLWVNERTGKKGYSPAVKGGWSGPRNERRDYLPLRGNWGRGKLGT